MDGSDISVIVPVRDCEQYVAEALESILGQSAPPGEVLVVDDGSADGTPAALARFGDAIRVARQGRLGIAAARNAGVAGSTGALLAFLDADDLYPPTSLECRLARLESIDRPDVVFGRIEQFVSPELDERVAARFRFAAGPQRVTLFQTMLARRPVFERVGPVDERYVASADTDWMSRARLSGIRVAEVDDVVARRRLHQRNHSIIERDQKQADLLRVVRAHRRRNLVAKRDDDGATR